MVKVRRLYGYSALASAVKVLLGTAEVRGK